MACPPSGGVPSHPGPRRSWGSFPGCAEPVVSSLQARVALLLAAGSEGLLLGSGDPGLWPRLRATLAYRLPPDRKFCKEDPTGLSHEAVLIGSHHTSILSLCPWAASGSKTWAEPTSQDTGGVSSLPEPESSLRSTHGHVPLTTFPSRCTCTPWADVCLRKGGGAGGHAQDRAQALCNPGFLPPGKAWHISPFPTTSTLFFLPNPQI